MLRFAKNQFNAGSKATIGMEMSQKILKVDTPDQQYVRAQVWDTCGQERFKSISGLYFKAAVGALLVYDITSRDSFENVSKWMAQIKEKADPNIVMILIGNKSDLSDIRQVKMDEAMHYAEMNRKFIYINNILEIAYIETSALNASNVEKAFKNLVTEIYKISKAHQ